MIESYKVGVTVFLNNLVGRGLATLGSQMAAAQKRADLLQRDLNKLQKQTGAQGAVVQRLARAQAQSVLHFERAARVQDALAAKTNRLRDVQARMAADVEAHNLRRAQWHRRLEILEAKQQLTAVNNAKRLVEQRQLLRAATNEGRMIRQNFTRKEEEINRNLGHIWDKAAIAQNQLLQARYRTQRRILALDNEIQAKEAAIAEARRKHKRTSGYKEELQQLRERRAALAANLAVAETRARVTGEQLAAKGAMLQAQRTALISERRAARAANLAKRANLENRIEQIKADTAVRMMAMEQTRQSIMSRMQAEGGKHSRNQIRLAEREAEIRRDMANTQALAEKEIAKARMAQFQVIRSNAYKNQLETAQKAVRAEQARVAMEAEALAARSTRLKFVAGAGAAAAATGFGMISVARNWIPEAAEYRRSLQATRATNPEMLDLFQKEAKKASLGYAPFLSLNDSLQTLLDLHKAFGDARESIRFMPSMTRLMAAMQHTVPNMNIEQAREQAFSIAKALELFGAARPGPKHDFPYFDKYLEMMGRTIMFSGGRLTGEDFQSVAKFVGASVTSLSPEFLFEQLPWLMTAFKSKGSDFGNIGTLGPGARIAAFQRFVQGTGSLDKNPARLLDRMGLLRPGSFVDGKVIKKMPLIGADIAIQNPFQWTQEVFLPAFEKTFGKIDWENITTQKFKYDGLDLTLTQLIQKATQGNQYAGSILAMFLQNAELVRKEQKALQTQQFPNQVVAENQGAWSIVKPFWDSQKKIIGEGPLGQGALDRFSFMTQKAGEALNWFNQKIHEHPGMAKIAGEAVMELGIGLTGLGAVVAGLAIAKWLGIGAGLAAIGTALGAAAFGTAGTIAVGLGAVAAAIGAVWAAAKYFLDEDFKTKVNNKVGGWWGDVKQWFSDEWEIFKAGFTGNATDFPAWMKDRKNQEALAAGMPLPFPERSPFVLSSGILTNGRRVKEGENIPNYVMRPGFGQRQPINISVDLDGRQVGQAAVDVMLDDFTQPLPDQGVPDYREIPTTSDGRTER